MIINSELALSNELFDVCVRVQLSGPKKKLVVTSRSEYPVKEGFPQSLLTLKVNNIR
jgi:hypothetical protein